MGINRGTVLDLINDVHRSGGFKDYSNYSYLFDQVDTMPESKEDAEPHWIPCSERLPEEDVDVLCQTVSGARLVASYGLLSPWHKEKGWITSEFNRFSKEMIKAWMPLPEMWRGEVTE